MTKREKLISRFLAEPPEIDFDDVRNLLAIFGYSLRKGGSGSHQVFVKQGEDPITIPLVSGRKVKRTYIRRINEILDLEAYGEP